MFLRSERPYVSWCVPILVFAAVSGCQCQDRIRLIHSDPDDPAEVSEIGVPYDSQDAGTLIVNGLTEDGNPVLVHVCLDQDGDGYGEGDGCLGPDCDDGDAQLGANGQRSCYPGPAGTLSVGTCSAGTQSCSNGVLSECVGAVVPTVEVCDGEDNDCDGVSDEQVTQVCYGGPAGTAGVGVCISGVQTCNNGHFGTCVGQVLPSAEVCDNLDNDCDGDVDEQLVRTCYDGPQGTKNQGACGEGVQTCVAGSYGACVGETLPTDEVCDNVDNDCDGRVDELLVRSCYDGPAGTAGVGVCATGTQSCSAGVYGACLGERTPSAELCDNADNDCDGQTDEDLVRSCYGGPAGTAGVGSCVAGSQTCSAGAYGTCVGEVRPATEVCDNVDNDCDGTIDDGVTRSCYEGPAGTEGVGTCKAGTSTCSAGAFGACSGQVTPVAEVCDAKDNDCDGTSDEELVRSCYDGPKGTDGVGVCVKGTQTCTAGAYTACAGEVVPTAEVCDNQDNDCDGATDDQVTRSCYDGPAGSAGVGVCVAGTQTCSAGVFGACSSEALPQTEVCDGVDNNCNGNVDENVTVYGQDGTDQAINVNSKPVDIIFVIDNSGSMTQEIESLQRNINTNFASIIAKSGVDYRVIMVTLHGDTKASYGVCVQSPLSGNGNCTAPVSACPVNSPPHFFHYSVDIDSHASLAQVIDTYNKPDNCGLAPNGWSEWLRKDSLKVFIEMSDDGPNSGNPDQTNSYTADTFESKLFGLRPAVFGSANARNYNFYSIVGLHENSPSLAAWLPSDPLVTTRCTANGGFVVQAGIEYQRLSQRSGGLRFPICEYQSFDTVFRAIANSVIISSRMACDFQVTSVPSDSSMANTLMQLVPTNGGAIIPLAHVAGQSSCSGNAFYNVGDTVTLCPNACAIWQSDPTARAEVLFTCWPQVH